MATDLLLPKLGLTMTEGVLLEWKVAPGGAVSKGETLYVVETEKVATDVEADADGVLAEQLVAEGETIPVGTVVGRLAGSGAGKTVAPRPASPAAAPGTRRIVATPLARRRAAAQGVDLAAVRGTGPNGRIKAIDVETAAAAAPIAAPQPQSPAPAPAPPHSRSAAARSRPSPTHAAMARRLAEVKHGVPHFYLSTEIEVSALLKLRAELNADAALPRLTLNHFVLVATGRALLDQPTMNRVWADGELASFADTDVSMAVETDAGLVVPVVRNAGSRPLDAVAADARRLVESARAGRLSADDVGGAAIAVSNAGMHDVTWVTSIINPGQSAILGVGSVRETFRPGADGAPELRREMGVVLSADHRVHTGVEGLAFLAALKRHLESPMRLLRPARA